MEHNGFYQLYMLLRHPCRLGPQAIRQHGEMSGAFFVYMILFIIALVGSITFDSEMMNPMDSLGLAYPFLNMAQHRVIISLIAILVMTLQVGAFGWIFNTLNHRLYGYNDYPRVVTTLLYLAAYQMVIDIAIGMVLLLAGTMFESVEILSFLLSMASTIWCLVVAVYTVARQFDQSYVDTFSSLLVSAIIFVVALIVLNILIFII